MRIHSPQITGSAENTNIVTVTRITSLNALSASFASTASFVQNAQSASYVLNAVSASRAVSSSRADSATTASYVLNAVSSSFAATSSYADNFTVGGTLTAQTINVQIITSSIEFNTGSTRNGALSTNTHQFTGSVLMSGSVGIGTSTFPTSVALNDLLVIGRSGSSSNSIVFTDGGSTRWGFVYANSTKMAFSSFGDIAFESSASATERMRITAAGNVGIGTTSPIEKLDITKNGNQTDVNWGSIMIRNIANYAVGNDASIGFALNNSGNTNCDPRASIGCKTESTLGGALVFNTRLDAGTYNEKMRITGAGNVGIGATSPTYKLEVSTAGGSERIRVGTLQNNNNTATFEAITSANLSTATSGWIRAVYGGGLAIGTSAYTKAGGDSGNFANLSAESQTTAMHITSGGVVYVNTTTNPTPTNAAPQFGVLAGAGTDAVNIKHTVNGNNTLNIWQTGTTQHAAISFYKGDSQDLRGNIIVSTSAVSYNTTSDYRLKENISPIVNSLDRVMQLKPSKFNWVETGEESEGFIAHELQEIFPYAVAGEKDAIYSSTGNIKPQSVDYGRITPLLVKAIQELKAEIDILKNK
jgi:hypothetical protein